MRCRFASAPLCALVLLALPALLAGCGSGPQAEQPEYLNPTPAEDFDDLTELITTMDKTVELLEQRMRGELFDVAERYASNLRGYARALRYFEPEGRTAADVDRFDTFGTSMEARADLTMWYARQHMHIAGMREVGVMREYMEILKTYLGPPRRTEGDYYRERITPVPGEDVDPRAVPPMGDTTSVHPTEPLPPAE